MAHRTYLFAQWAVALAATATSLTWSYVLHWIPCDLCWYERICMYPIFVISTIALVRRDERTFRYVLPLTVIGALVSLWHTLEQVFPLTFSSSAVCLSPVSCANPEFAWFGWIVPPLFAFVGFVLIGILAVLGRRAVMYQ